MWYLHFFLRTFVLTQKYQKFKDKLCCNAQWPAPARNLSGHRACYRRIFDDLILA